MRPILTPAQASALDRDSRTRGVSVDALMENAGRAVAVAAEALAGGAYGRRAVVVAGKGNNGGDGLVAARHLARRGMGVTVVLVWPADALREPSSTNLERLRTRSPGVRVRPLSVRGLERELARADIVIDAIFGTGFRGVPEDDAAEAIEAIAAASRPVVAVDIPSGVNGESGSIEGSAVRADVTLTFGAAKPGVVLPPGAEAAGVVEVVDIGFPADLVAAGDIWLLEAVDVAEAVAPRAAETHKREAGYVVVVGGSRRMTGAVCLSGASPYRAGAGLVTVAVPQGILAVVQTRLREATFVPLPETAEGSVASSTEDLEHALAAAGAAALGPGMTTNEETASFVRTLVRTSPVPIVLDADGLNAFVGRVSEMADGRSPVVLTPHAGEFARLSGMRAREVVVDRIGNARKLAAEANAVVLLKGSRTVIAAPDGRVLINTTGGPHLATGGTGDVLTGMIAAVIARGVDPWLAAGVAAYVHGTAGRLAGADLGDGTTAGDVLDRIAVAFREVLAA